jgi:NAD(P)-dependent dehydrogenase (short-subunit alcohol dehydrogenase family)
MPAITNHHVLVIGGTSGMGFGAASLALTNGCTVAIASSNPTRIASAISRLEASFPDKKSSITGHEIDLSTSDIEARLTTLFEAVTKNKTHLLDHVIDTSGRLPNLKPLAETNIMELLEETRSRVSTPLAIGKLAPAYMKSSYTSSITFTGGQVADKPFPNYTLFSFYAAGLYGLVKALALDLAPLRVNVVSPGATKTEMWGPEEMREMIAKQYAEKALLGKVGTPEELAEAYVYLMRNSDSTGSVVRSEGGSVLR